MGKNTFARKTLSRCEPAGWWLGQQQGPFGQVT